MEVQTNRKQQIICHEGFQYVFDKYSVDKITKYYRCRRRDLNCKGRIHVKNGTVLVTGIHGGHDVSPVEIEVSKLNFNK